ncbi:MAG: amidohydrolase [Nitrospirales bacterium]
MAILLEDVTLITTGIKKPVLTGQQIIIDRGVVADVGRQVDLQKFPVRKRIDCSEKIVMPGLINAHSHLTEVLQRSFRDNVRMETWREYRAGTEKAVRLTPEDITAAASLACAEMLKAGVTAVVDHFSTRPSLSVENMRAIVSAFDRTGIRGVLAPSLRDQDFLTLLKDRSGKKSSAGEEPWEEKVLEIIRDTQKTSKRTSVMLGPSNPLNCSDSLLLKVVEIAEAQNLGIHTHLLETKLQQWGARRLYSGGVVARLQKLGLLSPRLSAAHGIWLTEREMDFMASAGASVVHNPASNLKLGSGLAPVIKLRNRGVNVALGTDGGDTSDTYSIFEQMRLAAFLSRLTSEDSAQWVTSREALRMATLNGARAIPAWRNKIGKIQKGYCADLVVLKPHLRLCPLNDIVNQLVYCESGQSVDTVFVNGEIVLRNGRLLRVDERRLTEQVQSVSEKMYRTYQRLPRHGSDLRFDMKRDWI